MFNMNVVPEFANDNKQFFKLPGSNKRPDIFKKDRKPLEQSIADSIIDKLKQKASEKRDRI